MTTLTLHHGTITHAFEFVGDYSRSDFHITHQDIPNFGKITVIT
jgi:hypothetical protein